MSTHDRSATRDATETTRKEMSTDVRRTVTESDGERALTAGKLTARRTVGPALSLD